MFIGNSILTKNLGFLCLLGEEYIEVTNFNCFLLSFTFD